MKSPITLLVSLLTDVSRHLPGTRGLDRDLLTIKARFEYEGYGFLSVALGTLRDALDRGLSDGIFSCPTNFSKLSRGTLPRIFSGLFSEIFDPKTGHLKESPCVGAIKCLREILSLFKKVKTSSLREGILHKKACDTFWGAEATLSNVTMDKARLDYLKDSCKYILTSLYQLDASKLSYRNGPGAVAEGLTSNQKWYQLAAALEEGAVDPTRFGFESFIFPSIKDSGLVELVSSPVTTPRDCAKLISVPKNSTSRRTITVEPVLNMFIQQGLNTALRSSIERCSVLKNCLALTDQSKNQQLALIGSQTGEYATLDLKSASDLLDYSLVKEVFSRHEEFLLLMDLCRTETVQEGSFPPVQLRKFAGMGNALTFPVQSVVFAMISISAILFEDGKRPSLWNVKRCSRRIRVYGDDIIIPTKYADQVVVWLESFGLIVNRKKSFTKGNFRESCGLDAYKGVDVTPIYLKDEPDVLKADASSVAGFVAASNSCWDRCLYALANSLAELAESVLQNHLPVVSRTSGAIGLHSRVDSSMVQRWNKDLHRPEVWAPVITSPRRRDKLDASGALLKFFCTSLLERSEDHLSRSAQRYKSRIRWKWMPA